MDPEDEAALLALPPPPTSLLPSTSLLPTSSLPLLPSDDQCSVHLCPWASSLPYSPPSSPQQPLCPRTPSRVRKKRPAPPPPPPSTPLPPLPRTLGFSASSRFLDDCRADTFAECLANLFQPLFDLPKPRIPFLVLPIVLFLALLGLGLGLGLGLHVTQGAEKISGVGGSSQAILLLGGTDGASNRTLEIISGDH